MAAEKAMDDRNGPIASGTNAVPFNEKFGSMPMASISLGTGISRLSSRLLGMTESTDYDLYTNETNSTSGEIFSDVDRNSSSGDSAPFSQDGMIIWYICFSVVVLVPFFVCSGYCWYTRFMSHRRAQAALDEELRMEREQALSRIEANVLTFSVNESIRNTKRIRFALRRQIETLSRADIRAAKLMSGEKYGSSEYLSDLETGSQTSGTKEDNLKDSSTEASESGSFSSGTKKQTTLRKFALTSDSCNVCLERFAKGDKVAHASHHSSCTHVFHEECIVTWFAKHPNEPYCPCCRQLFMTLPKYERNTAQSVTSHMTPQTSLESHEQFTTMGVTLNLSQDAATDLAIIEDEVDSVTHGSDSNEGVGVDIAEDEEKNSDGIRASDQPSSA